MTGSCAVAFNSQRCSECSSHPLPPGLGVGRTDVADTMKTLIRILLCGHTGSRLGGENHGVGVETSEARGSGGLSSGLRRRLKVPTQSKRLLFSRSVMFDSLRPHGLQHARLPCPLLSLRVCSNLCPLRLERAFFPLTLWRIHISIPIYHYVSFHCLVIYHLSCINHAFIIYRSFIIIYLPTIYLSNSIICLWSSVVAQW